MSTHLFSVCSAGLKSCIKLPRNASNANLTDQLASEDLGSVSTTDGTAENSTAVLLCDVWKLWVRVLSPLLVKNSAISGTENDQNKATFMRLLTPSNGVGVLAAPLQQVLKVSRVLASECYVALTNALVLSEVSLFCLAGCG